MSKLWFVDYWYESVDDPKLTGCWSLKVTRSSLGVDTCQVYNYSNGMVYGGVIRGPGFTVEAIHSGIIRYLLKDGNRVTRISVSNGGIKMGAVPSCILNDQDRTSVVGGWLEP